MSPFRRWLQDVTIQGALVQALLPLIVVGVLVYFGYGHLVGHGSKDAGPGTVTRQPEPAPRAPYPQGDLSGPPPILLDGRAGRGESAGAELRQSYTLRALVPEESDLRISSTPRGVYGFAEITDVRSFVNKRPPSESDEFRLVRGPQHVPGQMEIHKLQDRSIRLVGFVSRDVALQLHSDARKSPRITMYNVAWPNADYLVSIRENDVKAVRDIRVITFEADKGGFDPGPRSRLGCASSALTAESKSPKGQPQEGGSSPSGDAGRGP